MTLREKLIAAFDAFVANVRMGHRRLSTVLFGSGSRYDQILAGSDVSTGTFERAMRWLSDNWPDGAEWPADVERPNAMEERASEDKPILPEAAE